MEKNDIINKPKVIVGMGTRGIEAGARDVLAALVETAAEQNLSRKVVIQQSGYLKETDELPVVKVIDTDDTTTVYVNMTPEKAQEVITKHIEKGERLTDYIKK